MNRRETNPSTTPGKPEYIRVVLDEDLAAGGSAAASVYYLNNSGTWVDTGQTEKVYDAKNNAIGSGTACIARLVSGAYCVWRYFGDAIAGGGTTYITTKRFNGSLVEQWNADHGANLNVIDTDGTNVVEGGDIVGGVSLRNRNASGVVQWSINAGTVWSLYIFGSYVYVGNFAGDLKKVALSDGAVAWTINPGDVAVSVDSGAIEGLYVDGTHIYAATRIGSGRQESLFKIKESDQSMVWYSHFQVGSPGTNVNALRLIPDSSGNMYAIAGSFNGNNLIKINSVGTATLWETKYGFLVGEYPTDIAVDSSDDLIVVGYPIDAGAGVHDYSGRKFNSSGVHQFYLEHNNGDAAADISDNVVIDASGNIISTNGGEVFIHNSSGVQTARSATTYDHARHVAESGGAIYAAHSRYAAP